MAAATGIRDRAEALDILLARSAETRLRLPAGQVLFYRGHLAPGIFVVLTGSVVRAVGRRTGQPARTPLVVPAPADLDARSTATVRVSSDADVLFFARSRVRADGPLRRLLGLLAGEQAREAPA